MMWTWLQWKLSNTYSETILNTRNMGHTLHLVKCKKSVWQLPALFNGSLEWYYSELFNLILVLEEPPNHLELIQVLLGLKRKKDQVQLHLVVFKPKILLQSEAQKQEATWIRHLKIQTHNYEQLQPTNQWERKDLKQL